MTSQHNDISTTIDRMINATSASASATSTASSASTSTAGVATHQSPFIPSNKWKGPIGGYYFGTSDEGTGYYLDDGNYSQSKSNGKKRSRQELEINGQGADADADADAGGNSRRKVRFGQDEIQTYDKDENNNDNANSNSNTHNHIKKTPEQLLEEAEEKQKTNPSKKTLDLTNSNRSQSSIKSNILSLEKSISKNQLLRVKHSNDPSKFMTSEINLYEEIEVWNDLAASIEYYSLFVNMGAVDSLKGLLVHENIDIVSCVIQLFNELLDPDLLMSGNVGVGRNSNSGDDVNLVGEQLCTLMQAFLGWGEGEKSGSGSSSSSSSNSNSNTKGNSSSSNSGDIGNSGLDIIIANLTRLNESEEEEMKAIDDILTFIENLLDLDQMGVLKLGTQTMTAAAATIPNRNGDDKGKGDDTSKIKKTIASHLTKNTTFTSYILMKLSEKKNKSNDDDGWTISMKLHASEVLASIMQHEDSRSGLSNISNMMPYTSIFDDDDDDQNSKKKNRKKQANQLDGMECLLQAIAMYRKKDPTTEEECEYLENLFNTLAASLFNDENVKVFLERQGIELMLRCINERVHAGFCSMKILFFSLSGSSQSYKIAAEAFVDAGGMKSLFPMFMGRKSRMPKPAKCSDAGNVDLISKYATLQKENRRKGKDEEQKKPSRRMKQVLAANREWFQTLEAHSIQILYGLTRYLNKSSPHDAKFRLASKFIENDCEKCDRLVELCLKYDAKMRQAEYDYFKSDEAEEAEENGIDIDYAAMNAKLKAGGDLFHRLGALIAFAASESKRCHEHILEQLRIQNSGIGVIKAAISEFADLINDEGKQRKQLMDYLSAI